MSEKFVKLDSIKVNKEIFIRDDYDQDAVERYAEIYEGNGQSSLPPLVIQKSTRKLIDGFHRKKALEKIGSKKARVIVKDLDDIELREFAARQNMAHGIPLSKDERNELIKRLYLEDNKTQSEIGDIFNLSQNRVSEILGVSVSDKTNIRVIKERYTTNQTQKEIAKNYEITQSRASQIEREFKDEINEKFLTGSLEDEIKDWIQEKYHFELRHDQLTDILAEIAPEPILENDKIICGDFFEKIGEFDDKTFPLIYVDPPYNILKEEWDDFTREEYLKFTEKWLTKLLPKLADDGRIYISFSQERMFDFHELMTKFTEKFDLIFENVIVWNYKNNIKPHDKKGYKYTWEPVFYYRKKSAGKLNLPRGTDWKTSGEMSINDVDCWTIAVPQSNFVKDKKYHPAQKPLELLKRIIITGSKERDTILDPFAGVGTTALACRQLNRNFVIIEKNPDFAENARRRILDEQE